jgi:septum formation protein
MIILASNSPRRKEILTKHNINFKIVVSNVEEIIDNTLHPTKIAESLAFQKAQAVFKSNKNDIVLGFDTIVVLDNKIYPKPKDINQEKEFLLELSNKTHMVITGCAILSKSQIKTFHEISYVTFKELTEEDIQDYIDTNEWIDKAGGYAIQGEGKVLISSFEGDLDNIIGLPITTLKKELIKFI